MEAIMSLGLGYLIGCISPAAWIGKRKHVNLKEEGSKNLGATNTAIVLGRAAGIFVMIFDIAKSFLSAKLAKYLFPQLAIAGMLACIGTIIGHCYPVFLNFQGGKGLAAYGGMILAYKPWFFLAIVVPAVLLMVLLDTGVAAPILATFMFPALTYLYSRDMADTLCVLIASIFIFAMHWSNLQKARENKDGIKVNTFFENILFKKKEK